MVIKKIPVYAAILYQRAWEKLLQTRNNMYYTFMFHDVVKTKTDMYDPQFCITTDSFTQFCYSIKDYMENTDWNPIITFDDGFQGVFENAFPILRKEKLDFIVFITYNFLDQEGYLSSEQLIELSKDVLCEIGSHTKSHLRLSDLSAEKLMDEIGQSKNLIERLLDKPVECFAYPYGDVISVKKREKKCVRDSNYKFAFGTLCAGFNKSLQGNYYIPRINVNEDNWRSVLQDVRERRL